MRIGKRLVIASLSLAVLATTIRAGILPTSLTVTPMSGGYQYSYDVVLSSNSVVKPGDYFTIYDMGGLVSNSSKQPANWAFKTEMTGGTPGGTTPTDNPNIPNLTWTYTGTTPLSGQMDLGNFSVLSSSSTTGLTAFTAQTHQVNGIIDSNITDATTPVGSSPSTGSTGSTGSSPSTPGVPEPGTLLLVALGLPLGAAARKWAGR